MNGPSRSYYALGFFGLGYFVSEAVRIYYRRRPSAWNDRSVFLSKLRLELSENRSYRSW